VAEGDQFVLTRDALADAMAQALTRDRQQVLDDQASQSARERLVRGAVGAWLRHRWKRVTALLAVMAGGWQGWTWLQTQAEQSVLERQATEAQSTAVQENTEAFGQLRTQTGELTKRVGGLEIKVEAASDIQQVILELQLRDPKTKRMIKADKKLKERVEALPGVTIQ